MNKKRLRGEKARSGRAACREARTIRLPVHGLVHVERGTDRYRDAQPHGMSVLMSSQPGGCQLKGTVITYIWCFEGLAQPQGGAGQGWVLLNALVAQHENGESGAGRRAAQHSTAQHSGEDEKRKKGNQISTVAQALVLKVKVKIATGIQNVESVALLGRKQKVVDNRRERDLWTGDREKRGRHEDRPGWRIDTIRHDTMVWLTFCGVSEVRDEQGVPLLPALLCAGREACCMQVRARPTGAGRCRCCRLQAGAVITIISSFRSITIKTRNPYRLSSLLHTNGHRRQFCDRQKQLNDGLPELEPKPNQKTAQ